MKARKILSLVLCAALCVGMAGTALAAGADAADQALLAVTAKVKQTLGLDTEIFTDFQGWADEDVLLGKRWNLRWEGDGVSLNITADDNGKIYSYNRFESVSDPVAVESRYFGGRLNIPRLPEDKSAAAYEAALAFVGKVLEGPVETVKMENSYSPSLSRDTYRYGGTILLNGLTSPVECSVSVRASDLTVTRFWRTDEGSGYLGGVPAVVNKTTDAQARRDFRPTVEMEAKFVLGGDGKKATVQYVPVGGDEYYVDGETGKLVNLTELRRKMWENGAVAGGTSYRFEAAMDTVAEAEAPKEMNSLTQAERDGAAILEGALSKEDIDRAVKGAWPELGLDKYTLASASFSIQKKELPDDQTPTADDYDITCRLTYGKQEGQVMRNKYVTADAKTGELKSLWSRRYYEGAGKESYRYAANLAAGKATAQTVLKSFAGANFDKLALKDTVDAQVDGKGWEHRYQFQQKAGDWFYEGNSFTVGIDATDGTVSSLSGSFDQAVELVVPKEIVAVDAAKRAYVEAMAMPFGYLEVPVSISLAGSDVMPLLKEAGYSYVLALKTGYVLTQPEKSYVRGVDAVTGEAVVEHYSSTPDNAITYDDLEGHWVKAAAQELAVFDIGLRGGSLRPAEGLTQLDMIALLASVEGYAYDPTAATRDETDWLYERAYSMGLVTPETRNETAPVTRGQLVKLILDAAGYARIAALPSIFRCDFADSAAIADADMGYAALAQGFGLVRGGSDGAYAGTREATRAEAVSMLYQYMK